MTQPTATRYAERLKERGAATWSAAVAHPMVGEIGRGTLPHATFRFYFEQNIRYLSRYVAGIAYALASAPDRAAQETLTKFAMQIVDVEIPANEAFLQRLGGGPDQLPAMLPTTRAYTDHIVSVTARGPLPVGLAALLPCQWSYGEIGQSFSGESPADPIYADWISVFAAPSYGDLVDETTQLLDRVSDESDLDAMASAFDASTRYELAFWEMAYTQGAQP